MFCRHQVSLWKIIRGSLALTVGLSLLGLPASAAPGSPTEAHATLRARISETLRGLPLSFEANRGQAGPQADFIARAGGHTVFLTSREAVLLSPGPVAALLRLRLVGANARSQGVGLNALPGRVHYLRGNDPAQWRTNIPAYAQVRYGEIYPGIDLVYHGTQRRLEYDFVVRPGADPARIALAVEGAQKIEVDREGDLLLHLVDGMIRHKKPVIYQEVGGLRREVPGGYALKGTRQVGFAVAAYDRSRPLVIDPLLFYSTYFGGSDDDDGDAIAIDSDGSVYITGGAVSIDFPTTAGAVQAVQAGVKDAFVVKLDPAGALVYSTYLGGAGEDVGRGIAVDPAGNAYVTGETESANFPTTAGGFRTTLAGLLDTFVVKLDPAGALVYSTFLGGAGDDEPRGIALDPGGNAYVAGKTTSTDFPTTPGAHRTTLLGLEDAFVTKLDAAGATAVYSTYLGGASDDDARGIAVDPAGSAHVTGETFSTDFPVTAGAFRATLAGAADAFVTKLDASGSALAYSTYLGGTGADRGFAIALDTLSPPNAYVTGRTASANFPTTAGAFQSTIASSKFDAFVTKLDPGGSTLVYSSYLGGASDEEPRAIAVDTAGYAYVTGRTLSTAFPTTADAFRTTLSGRSDAFVTKVDPAGSALAFSTYLGGSGEDDGRGMTVDGVGSIYVAGQTASTDFPVAGGAADATFNGVSDVFVVKITNFGPAATLTLAPSTGSKPVNTQHCVNATVTDASGIATPGVTVRFAVSGAVTTAGSAATDANGQAGFCYTGPSVGGTDTISAFADTNANSAQDAGEPGNTATNTWNPPAALTLAPSAATSAVNTQHCVTATVADASGTATPGVTVRFAVSGSVTTAGSATTGANGRAGFCYAGPSVAGTDTISAFADTSANSAQDAGEPGNTATKTWAVPAALALAPNAANSAVNTQHCVTATVADASGTAIPGATVRFAVSGSVTAAGSATAGANGQAGFCYAGPSVAGTDTISAFADTNINGAQDAGEPGSTATKTWAVPAALTLAPSTGSRAVNTQHCVTATVADASGTVTPGVTVRFAVSGSVTTAGSAATGANGQAGFCYTGPSVAGTDTISAFADTNVNGAQDADEPGGTATNTWNPPAALTLAPSTANGSVGTQHCVAATVGDAASSPVPGVTVRFAVSGSVTTAGSAITAANGRAGFCYAGPSVAGTDTISAFADTNANSIQDAGEPSGTATKTWVVPAALTLAPGTATNPVNTQHCVTATVGDAASSPVPGVTVRFAVTGSVTTAGSSITDANGQAGFCYTGPSVAGTDTISAFADTNANSIQDAGEPGGTATNTWNPPAALTLVPNTATNPVGTQHCVTATATDSSGHPVPGVTVPFTVTGSVATTGSTPTDATGQATFCYLGPTTPGSDSIAAFADTNANGAQDPGEPGATATKTWAQG